jgi:hypothetical protein
MACGVLFVPDRFNFRRLIPKAQRSTESDELPAGPFQVGNVWVMYPGALKKRLRKSGPLSRETMERIARRLDLSLPPA